jgi:hypothetical protein
MMIGTSGADRSKPAWRQTFRAVDHGSAKNACKNTRILSQFPKEIEDFGNLLLELQQKRHDADYDPFSFLTRSSVSTDLDAVKETIREFKRSPVKDKRAFAAFILFKKRS